MLGLLFVRLYHRIWVLKINFLSLIERMRVWKMINEKIKIENPNIRIHLFLINMLDENNIKCQQYLFLLCSSIVSKFVSISFGNLYNNLFYSMLIYIYIYIYNIREIQILIGTSVFKFCSNTLILESFILDIFFINLLMK